MYDSQQTASSRLRGSVVTIDRSPHFVLEVDPNISVWCKPLQDLNEKGDHKIIPLRELRDRIDLTPVKLGMINTHNTCYYGFRNPVRKWKQGLDDHNFAAVDIYGNRLHMTEVDCRALTRTINGEYPSFEETKKRVVGSAKDTSLGFSRKFALVKIQGKVMLQYKKNIVGELKDNERPTLDEGYNYLETLLFMAIERSKSYA